MLEEIRHQMSSDSSASCSIDGDIHLVSDKDNSEVRLSGGRSRQCPNDKDSTEGDKPTEFTPGLSASSGGPRRLLQRIHRFFRRIKRFNGKVHPMSAAHCCDGVQCPISNKHPEVCPTDGDIHLVPDKDNSEVCSTDGDIHLVPDKDNSEVCLPGERSRQCLNDKDLTAASSEGAKPTDFTPDVSATPGGLKKLLKRIHRLFRRVKRCKVSDKDNPRTKDQTPNLRDQGESMYVSVDKEPNSLMRYLNTYFKEAGVQGENPQR